MNQEPYMLITADTHARGQPRSVPRIPRSEVARGVRRLARRLQEPGAGALRLQEDAQLGTGVRNNDQNSQGVVGEVVFPNTVPPFYARSDRDAPFA